jgi:nitrogen regulatory protein P-II 2
MQNTVMKRVIIIGDTDLESRLLNQILELGATGYTCYGVRGRGARGIRPRHAKSGNIKIEVIATAEVAQGILEHVAKEYFEQYAMIALIDDVEVLNGDKFGAKPADQKARTKKAAESKASA